MRISDWSSDVCSSDLGPEVRPTRALPFHDMPAALIRPFRTMPKIVFIQPDGRSQSVDAPVGQSLMEAATTNLVRGVVGDCGGSCSCATCHLYIDEAWFDKQIGRAYV